MLTFTLTANGLLGGLLGGSGGGLLNGVLGSVSGLSPLATLGGVTSAL